MHHHGGTEGTEKVLFVCREVPANKKVSGPIYGVYLANGLRFTENRYLPILRKNILLAVLCVSNESRLSVTSGW